MKRDVLDEIISIKERLNEIEKKLSSFAVIKHDENRSDIDYIAMETGVDLDQDSEV